MGDRFLDRLNRHAEWVLFHRWRSGSRGLRHIIPMIEREGTIIGNLSDDELRSYVTELRQQLRRCGLREELVARSFATVREAASRTLGLRHYETQFFCGWALLKGVVAEMATGEGKSLAATLPACTAAFAGMHVHVVTVNDYLVARDAAVMEPLYRFLGLTCGQIVQGMDPRARQAAYGCNITYCNNKELVFDYLKDRILLGSNGAKTRLQMEKMCSDTARTDRLLLRGLQFAIVDEADSVLIDEARTPLIISGERDRGRDQEMYRQALDLAGQLVQDVDFVMGDALQETRLTDRGKARVAGISESLQGVWLSLKSREELVIMALLAQHRFIKDHHYLVTEGKVQIIDEYTGRLMPDRSWEGGLHQMIETKEECSLSKHRETVARITYQRFFRRYLMLSGMTGTAAEVACEFWSVYGLRMVKIPTHRPSCRKYFTEQVMATQAEKWAKIIEHVVRIHSQGRPVLIGTKSVKASERLSDLLTVAGFPHQVLNARQDRNEAEIISRAGSWGQITIATNMAGRGTDIKLSPGVAEKGGLHVILTERHDARRIDRQLFGRCARQGDPGSCIAIVSLEDDLFIQYLERLPRLGRKSIAECCKPMGQMSLNIAQRAAERVHARIRRTVLETDKRLDKLLAFTGRVE